ncbi:MAG: carboxypeptidase-like regulatory domain-containing protein [Bacteroidia bacterium]
MNLTFSPQSIINWMVSFWEMGYISIMRKSVLFASLFLCFLLLSTTVLGQDKVYRIGSEKESAGGIVKIGGSVLQSETEAPIFGAEVEVRSLKQKTTTDSLGQFLLALPSGIHQVHLEAIGFLPFDFQVRIYEDGNLVLRLELEIFELEEVVIEDESSKDPLQNISLGLEHMELEKMERQSLFMGETDVLRSLQSVSGVSSVGEGASGFNVRGGNADENLILQDGGLVLNPTHALGIFSLFHPDLLSEFDLYKGGAPARYGGRLSSVLSVKLREGNRQKYKGKGGVGLASSRLSFEGPIRKGKSSFLVGVRASHLNWIIHAVNNIDLQKSDVFFYDVTAKIDGRWGQNTRWGVSFFDSGDTFQFAEEAKLQYGTRSGTAYLKHLVGDKLSLNADANVGRYTSTLFDVNGNDQSELDMQVDYYRSRLNALWNPTENQKINVGVEGNLYQVSPGALTPVGESILQSRTIPKELGLELSAYASYGVKLWSVLDIEVGLRYTDYRRLGSGETYLYQDGEERRFSSIIDTVQYGQGETMAQYDGLEPRFSLKWNVNERAALKAGYQRTYQYISQVSNTASAAPIDLWQLSDQYILPQFADSYSIGYVQTFPGSELNSSATVFYRDIHRLVDYKDFANLLLNEHLETEIVSGIGRAYGLETQLQHYGGKHLWEVNYTFSRSLRQVEETEVQAAVNGGNWYASYYDKPHNLNINYSFVPSKRHTLSFNFTYSTGRPTTVPISNFVSGNLLNIPVYSQRNQYRIPAYHRLDVSYTVDLRKQSYQKWESNWTFSIYNVYARKNAYSIYFRQTPFERVTPYRLAVLGAAFPSITYNFQF